MALLKTYTLYLRDGAGGVRFEPVMCATNIEVIRRARTLLKAHPEYEEVEAFFGEDRLFSVGRAASSASASI